MATKKQSVAQRIADAIKTSAKPAQAWCGGRFEDGDVGLEIDGVGPIKLPMRPADVRELTKVAQQAPYGKGTKTIVDTSVRDTLEVDGERVRLLPEFLEAVHLAGAKIAEQMHLDEERLQFELYKLLIYPKGGFFLPHRDSEKRPGMVATMVVVLPSRFGGGDLVITHAGRRQKFSFDAARSQKQPEYLAFFADCQHEVKKVTSGVRVCLAFNLILKPKRRASRVKSDPGVDPALREQVSKWMQHRAADALVFALEHQYTEAGLSTGRMKGADKQLQTQVAAVAESLGCRFYFGQVERHLCQFADDGSYVYGRRGYRSWSGDYRDLEIGEVYEDEITIDGWRTADGQPTDLGSLPCQSRQLISLQPTEEWIPTEQDYEGYTGNAGNTLDRWYHKSVIAIWPENQHFEITAQMGVEFAIPLLLEMREDLQDCPEDELEQACDNCQRLAEAIIAHWPNRKYEQGTGIRTDSSLKQFADELPKFDDPVLLKQFLEILGERDWHTILDQLALVSLQRMGADEILPLLERLIEFEPLPNEYGIRFFQGLATRDAKWLLHLAKDKKHGALSKKQLHKLLSAAYEKLASHALRCEQEKHRRNEPPTEAWLLLCEAMIISGDDKLGELLALAKSCSNTFDLRSFQVAAAINLRDVAIKRFGEIPKPLHKWIAELSGFLKAATSSEPQPPTDFRRDSETNCDCKFCRILSEFLSNPNQETTRIPAAEYNRNHMEQIIRTRRFDVATKTIKSGSPYSLALTKTTSSHAADVKRYKDDLKLLKKLN